MFVPFVLLRYVNNCVGNIVYIFDSGAESAINLACYCFYLGLSVCLCVLTLQRVVTGTARIQ